jgi:4-hydroxy-tetrahydrodipicolinate reductase
MKIALIGYGKMGQMVEKSALDHGHTISAKISSGEWDAEGIQQADICIEFTEPHSALKNIKKVAEQKKNLIIGTTGWYDQLASVQSIVSESQIGILYSPNFSIGINLLLEILRHTAKLMNNFPNYDVAEVETHHNQKKDAPSGTAIEIAKALQSEMKRIEQVPISSVRCGSVPGTHEILFDSPCDTISITHTARNREGFAQGAIKAAEWLQGKKGLYTFDDCIKAIIQGRRS